jgi:hypothetical protein
MKWSIGLILGLSLVLGVSVSRGEWQMEVHRGGASERFNLSEIDLAVGPEPRSGRLVLWQLVEHDA